MGIRPSRSRLFCLFVLTAVITHFVYLFSMEQSVSQATSVNHAAELDQILASYKVTVRLAFHKEITFDSHADKSQFNIP